MSEPKKHKPDDPEQSKRFIEDAKKLGASEKKEDADRAFKRVVSKSGAPAKQKPPSPA
jgi:hypothetical protein